MPSKKKLLIGVWSLAALAWVAAVPLALLLATKKATLLSLGGAALMTELAVYATAGLLGFTLVESRKRLCATAKAVLLQKMPEKETLR